MGIIAENPGQVEIAQAQETMLATLDAVRHAELRIIGRNVKLNGTNPEQEAFLLTFSEIRGIMQRAQARGADAIKKARPEIVVELDKRILRNPGYEKFRTGIATAPDPFAP